MRLICITGIVGNLLTSLGQTKPLFIGMAIAAAAVSAVVLVLNEITFGRDEE